VSFATREEAVAAISAFSGKVGRKYAVSILHLNFFLGQNTS
jgi:hypothetical protein